MGEKLRSNLKSRRANAANIGKGIVDVTKRALKETARNVLAGEEPTLPKETGFGGSRGGLLGILPAYAIKLTDIVEEGFQEMRKSNRALVGL